MNVVHERARKEGAIGSSLETAVTLVLPSSHPALQHLQRLAASGDLCDVLNASQVHLRVEEVVASATAASPAAESESVTWGHCSCQAAESKDAKPVFVYQATSVAKGGAIR